MVGEGVLGMAVSIECGASVADNPARFKSARAAKRVKLAGQAKLRG
jgi:hypothetical protein